MIRTRFSRPAEAAGSRGQAMVEFALVAPLLFILLIGIFEAGRYVLNLETLNNATREGARYAIVHGAKSSCPSGPMPGGITNTCDGAGDNIKQAVGDAAVGIASLGGLSVPTPVWTAAGSTTLPANPTDPNPLVIKGDNGRGSYVTVFVEYSYDPIVKSLFGTDLIPSITMSAESTLVINN